MITRKVSFLVYFFGVCNSVSKTLTFFTDKSNVPATLASSSSSGGVSITSSGSSNSAAAAAIHSNGPHSAIPLPPSHQLFSSAIIGSQNVNNNSAASAPSTSTNTAANPNSKYKLLSGPLMLDDDTASLVIEKQLALGLSGTSASRLGPGSSSFSDAASRVAASQTKSAIGGLTFDTSLFDDRRTDGPSPQRTTAAVSAAAAAAAMPVATSIASNGHLIEIVQSNSEMKAANAMLAMAKAAAQQNSSAANGSSTLLAHHGSPMHQGGFGANRQILDTDNGSDTASDEEMELHMAAAEAMKNQQQQQAMMIHQQQHQARTVMGAPTVGVAARSDEDDDEDDDDDKPLNLSATSSTAAATAGTSRVYQASNQQIIDIYIDKFLNTGMVCKNNGYANQANAPGARFRGSVLFVFVLIISNVSNDFVLIYFLQNRPTVRLY